MIVDVKAALDAIVGGAANLRQAKGAGRIFELFVMTGIVISILALVVAGNAQGGALLSAAAGLIQFYGLKTPLNIWIARLTNRCNQTQQAMETMPLVACH